MSLAELYTKDAKIWLPDSVLVWKCGALLEDYKGQTELSVRYDNGQIDKIKIKSSNDLPYLRNPEILIGENDLTSLSYLHEPAVLYNLQVRFCERNYIYTYCGIVLVAFNPYQQLPIYDNDTIHAYSGQDMASMDPHIFAVAEEAFKRMSRFEENQSIIVSGESGAGKTVSAKYAMRYFATVCGAEDETQIEKRVLATNPIMEAIGNAKTTRNDNSSRFGKYIQIGFSKNEHILGANMRTYLLEKSRVVFQAPEERNYHIFYQICSASNNEDIKEFELGHCEDFFYTNQGSSPLVNTINDSEDFFNTRQAMTMLGINKIRQNEIFRILAGILHLGNIEFKEDEKSSDSSFIPTTDGHLIAVAKLFGIDFEQIRYWLCNKKITTANEILTIPLTVAQVSFSRDALSKHIYSQLFLWIVNQLNKSLTSSIKMSKFIGVLDIYGFETFEINSFEQFCINYANEKLQQQFCLHVFKLEQEEYVREQIEWSFIDFYDNQPCIDLIESRLGILDLLDEECKMPKGSDKNWCRKLYEKHGKNKHFSKPRMSEEAFIIHHFADKVEYQMDGFLDKNRDTVLEEHINILKASEYELLAELFQEKSESPTGASRPGSKPLVRPAKEPPKSSQLLKQHRKTVGSQFSESLNLLMETLFSTTPHYVRCIKPNDGKLAFTFDAERAVQQLRACGVLETIRISAAGYPSRWTYPDFLKRYRVLAVSKNIVRNDVKKTCENILFKLISDKDKYQFGKSKIFFRAGQVAYLEKLRSDRLRACSILIQKIVRGWLARRQYKKVCKTVHLIQKFGRGLLARRHALFLRQSQASTTIRAAWLCYRCRRSFLKMRKSIVFIQSYGRALIGRQNFTMMHKSLKVMLIQRYVRGWLARRHFHRVQKGIVLMQAHIRRRLAKRQFKQLKIEARSVEHMKNVARGLENKIIELQQKLDEKVKENGLLREEQVQVLDLKNELVKLRGVKQSSTVMSNQIIELEDKIVLLTNQLENEKKEKDKISLDKENIKKEKDEIINALNQEKCWLKDQLEKVNQELLDNKNNQEDLIKQKVDESNAALKREFDLERSHHQKFVKDYARLQQRLDNIQSDLHLNTPNLHRRSPSNISNISLESESSGEKNDQDLGYYTSRKKEKEVDQICHADSDRHSTDDAAKSNSEKVDKKEIPLLIRFQNKVKDLEKENAKFRLDLDRRDFNTSELIYGSVDRTIMDMYEAFKVQELETENANIKNELSRLQKAVTDGAVNFDLKGGKGKLAANQLIADQLEALREELRHKHDECVRLRTLLMKPRVTNEIKETVEVESMESTQLNEDGELTMAYETQKELNLLLENELQRLKQASIAREQDLCNQIDQLKQDSNRQRKIIDQNLSLCSETKLDATVHLEIIRLANENLKLHDEINKLQDTVKKLKKALNIYAKRLKGTDVSDAKAELEREMAAEENLPAVKHHQLREFSGMLEYHKEDEQLLIRNLITDLKPEIMLKEIPGLPANILFMCMRYTDYMNDDEKVRTLLTNAINSIKKVVKKNQTDPGTIIAWLANTSRLLNNLKQYSGEKTFQIKNSLKQNEQSLKNFDLSEYRQILNDLGVWIYQILIKLTESLIQPMIVGAVLENEAISGCSSGKPTGVRRASSKNQGQEDFQGFGPVSLITILDDIMQKLWANDVDSELVQQLFKQLFYFICANALNNLLLRKDLCHWMKGIQIRYNLSQLEQWLRDSKLQECSAQDALEPIIQATQLLQARKTDADVDSICDMCSRLTTPQIIKILNLYTPMNEFEERVPISFIRKVQEKMSGVKDSSQSLLMDTKYVYTVTFEFNYSPLKLEALSIPDEWGLGFLKKI